MVSSCPDDKGNREKAVALESLRSLVGLLFLSCGPKIAPGAGFFPDRVAAHNPFSFFLSPFTFLAMPLRVISGSAGGLHLKSPKRHALRPTQDRIRQVIFSSLAEVVPGARALDLYAGTGSFGIEALSRGAASATFVEQDREAAQCIRDNLAHCHLQGEVRLADVSAFLAAPAPELKFDLIFADPPYSKQRGALERDPLLARLPEFISADGHFVWEHYAQQRLDDAGDWEVVRHKTYGETGLTFLRLSHKNKKITL
jgi:16S rRNA (guanine(966)-N(2))-methyltransferase RsmD